MNRTAGNSATGRRVPINHFCAAVVAAIALLCATTPLSAQDTPPTAWGRAYDATSSTSSDMAAAWLSAWSPLRPIIDAPRGLLRAPLAPGLLDAGAPLSGAFILAGAAGGLARDLRHGSDTARFSEIRVRTANESGAYRRPLDVAASSVMQASGRGYADVGARGVAIGRFVIDQEHNSRSAFTERVAPYLSAPFVVTDSLEPPMDRTRARLEGALGFQLGEFGVGGAAGVEVSANNSVNVPLRRTGRTDTPAANLGVERTLPWLSLRVGAYYRWSEPNESNILNATPRATVEYSLAGLAEPFGIPINATSGASYTRIDRRATSTGGSLSARVLSADIVVTHEAGQRADDQTQAPLTANRIDTQRWRAKGSETRLEVQRRLVRTLTATVVGSYESLHGDGRRADLNGIAFTGANARRAIEVDVRTPAERAWSVAVNGGAVQLVDSLTDYVAQVGTKSDVVTRFAAAEVAHRFGRNALALGVSGASTSPRSASIPPALSRQPQYQRLIAPAVAYAVAEAGAYAGWLTMTVPFRTSLLMVTARAERTSPSSAVPSRLQPTGTRSAWSVGLGIRP
ncbi:MAG: DUF6850 family outer membrane beta-barrel protein [Gemmatimonadaceae bacterium]